MSRYTKKNASKKRSDSFLSFLRQKSQRNQLIVFFLLYVLIYVVLTYLYPFPGGISDSGAYVRSAVYNKYDGYRPFGYSSFLISLHNISASYSIVVFVQFWLHALSTLLFIFSFKYIFRTSSVFLEYGFQMMSILSVSVLYLTNCILSDSLFTSLTTLWLVFAMWFIHARSIGAKALLLMFHVLVLGFLMHVRFTGFLYAIISFLFVIITLYRTNKKAAFGLALLPLFLMMLVYNNQVKATEETTKVESFGGFSGWQKANNALHVIPHVKLDTSEIESAELREFCRFLLQRDTLVSKAIKPGTTTAGLIWSKSSPLKLFLALKIQQKRIAYLTEWTRLGQDVYGEFGSIVMKRHLGAYISHFIIPNLWGALYPKSDQLYNVFRPDAVPVELRQQWFQMDPGESIEPRSHIVQDYVAFIPVYRLILWIFTLLGVIVCVIRIKKSAWSSTQKNIFWYFFFFVGGYLAFHVYAVPFETRYVAPVHIAQVVIIFMAAHLVLKRKPEETKQ